MLLLDFETRSLCDLIAKGSYNYAYDPSTTILFCSFTRSDPADDWEFLWSPALGPLPDYLLEEIEHTDYLGAHNAPFDRLIWECVAVADFGFPEVDFDKWYCTMAQCRVNNIPASLDKAARALNTHYKKSQRGAALIRLLCLPQSDGTFNDDPALMAELGEYALQDARTMKAIFNATRPMTEVEHADWLNNEDINERGVLIDTELAASAQRYANDEFIEISQRLHAATHGAITKHTQSVRAAVWIRKQLGDEHPALKLMRKYVKDEVKLTIDKSARADILRAVDLDEFELPLDVLEVVVCLQEASASSVTKFKNMLARADEETRRVQGAFIYAGASQSLRYSSRGLQLHNFPSRGLFETEEEVVYTRAQMVKGLPIEEPVMQTLKKMLRSAIIAPPKKKLIIGDWSGIEARVLPWLADSDGGRAKLAKIASGVDVYMEAAEAIGSDVRAVGKVMELALGYEGGLGAFLVFAKSYGVEMSVEMIKYAIKKWRALNAWVVEFWRDLERAARRAIAHPNKEFTAGRLRYLFAPSLMGGSLLCILPDDTVLTFAQARIERKGNRSEITALKASLNMKADAKEWPRESLYGGRLAGIGTQGTAAALLRGLLAEIDDVIAHVHDEVILEVDEDEAPTVRDQLEQDMCTAPIWAQGLPLVAVPEITSVYKK